jgi:hypothetical protein
MKRIAMFLAVMLMTVAAVAQNNTKRSIASMENDDNSFEIFAYDEDGTRGYFLQMNKTSYEVTSAVGLESKFMVLFVYLGSNVNEAAETMKGILALYDAPLGDTKKYTGRLGSNLPIGKTCDVKAVVQKKPLSKKVQLSFTLLGENANIVSWMQKSDAKMLLKFLTSYQKRHPDR